MQNAYANDANYIAKFEHCLCMVLFDIIALTWELFTICFITVSQHQDYLVLKCSTNCKFHTMIWDAGEPVTSKKKMTNQKLHFLFNAPNENIGMDILCMTLYMVLFSSLSQEEM